jgi:CheY-like chemotaxis protein
LNTVLVKKRCFEENIEVLNVPKAAPITILMVDDNIDEIYLAKREVRNYGILNQFVSERCPETLFSTLAELYSGERPTNVLILLDVSMPRMDGFETLKAIRNHERFKALPVIMFSVSDDEEDMSAAIRLGADGYLVKPFALEPFMSALGSLPEMRYQLFPGPLGDAPMRRQAAQ